MKGYIVKKEYGNSRTFTEKRSRCHVEKHHSILQLVLASANTEYCNYYFNFVVWLLRIESLLFFLRATVSISPGKRESDVSKSLTCKTPSSRSLKVKEGARVCGPWFGSAMRRGDAMRETTSSKWRKWFNTKVCNQMYHVNHRSKI